MDEPAAVTETDAEHASAPVATEAEQAIDTAQPDEAYTAGAEAAAPASTVQPSNASVVAQADDKIAAVRAAFGTAQAAPAQDVSSDVRGVAEQLEANRLRVLAALARLRTALHHDVSRRSSERHSRRSQQSIDAELSATMGDPTGSESAGSSERSGSQQHAATAAIAFEPASAALTATGWPSAVAGGASLTAPISGLWYTSCATGAAETPYTGYSVAQPSTGSHMHMRPNDLFETYGSPLFSAAAPLLAYHVAAPAQPISNAPMPSKGGADAVKQAQAQPQTAELACSPRIGADWASSAPGAPIDTTAGVALCYLSAGQLCSFASAALLQYVRSHVTECHTLSLRGPASVVWMALLLTCRRHKTVGLAHAHRINCNFASVWALSSQVKVCLNAGAHHSDVSNARGAGSPSADLDAAAGAHACRLFARLELIYACHCQLTCTSSRLPNVWTHLVLMICKSV